MILHFEPKTIGLIRSKSENINNRSKIFTPTPIKNKCLALWNKISDDGSNIGVYITRYVSNPELMLRKHSNISKFCSLGLIEMDNCDL